MTVEEIEFMRRYPRVPQERVPAILAELKRQQAIADQAKRAEERGVGTRPLDLRSGRETAVKTSCPRDGHGRFLIDGIRLNCPDRSCRCEECQKWLTPQEREDWTPSGR
jgi:hypothetical protein